MNIARRQIRMFWSLFYLFSDSIVPLLLLLDQAQKETIFFCSLFPNNLNPIAKCVQMLQYNAQHNIHTNVYMM